MKFKLDTHTHTIASGHAYSTIQEVVLAAKDAKLDLVAITEHAPTMPGSSHIFYFHNLKILPRELFGIEVLFGVEANIIDFKGHIDMDHATLKNLDIVIASLHGPCIMAGSCYENTQAVINAMKNPYVNIIGHPDDARFPLDYEAIVRAAKNEKVLLEVNNSSLSPKSFRLNARENYRIMLQHCKQMEVPIVVGSDAHFAGDVGNNAAAKSLLEEMDFPDHLIVNYEVDRLKEFLRR